MTTKLRAAGRLLAADTDDRVLTYLLLPFGEPGRTNQGTLTASANTIKIPDQIIANMEHEPTRPVARSTAIAETDAGITASFYIAPTTTGDDLLVEAREGLRTGISVEIEDSVIRAGKLLGGELTGAGFVTNPAFPSAQLVAADAGELPDWMADTESSTESTEEVVIDGVTYVRKTTSTYVTHTTPKTDDADPDVEDDTQEDPPVNASTTTTAPDGLNASAYAAGHALGVAEVARILASASSTGNPQLLAALTDIKYDGTGGIAGPMAQPQFIGELWSGRAYQRRIVPLLGHADLTSMKISGWRWKTRPVVAPWAGNKAAVPSGAAETEAYNVTAERLAGAHDIAREFRDFEVPGFWEGYFAAMTESYARLSDVAVANALKTAATAVTVGAVPAGTSSGLVKVVDGALSMIDTATPSYALLATDLWREVLLTPKDKTLEYLSSALSLEEGQLDGFRLVPWSGLTAGSVLVGAREAATVHELPGSPIRVEGLDMVKGGIDAGLFGYIGTVIHNAAALALVTDAPAG